MKTDKATTVKYFDDLYKNNQNMYGNKPSEWIVKILKYKKPPAKVLDFGICYGRNALYLARKGYDVSGVDISQTAVNQCLDRARKSNLKIKCLVYDIAYFKFDTDYDVIFSTATLHYLGNRNVIKGVINNMKKHTKSGGLNIISVPTNTKIGMNFPYYFTKNELSGYYKDWQILGLGEEEDLFTSGKVGTIGYIIAKNLKEPPIV